MRVSTPSLVGEQLGSELDWDSRDMRRHVAHQCALEAVYEGRNATSPSFSLSHENVPASSPTIGSAERSAGWDLSSSERKPPSSVGDGSSGGGA